MGRSVTRSSCSPAGKWTLPARVTRARSEYTVTSLIGATRSVIHSLQSSIEEIERASSQSFNDWKEKKFSKRNDPYCHLPDTPDQAHRPGASRAYPNAHGADRSAIATGSRDWP